jgi:hypothetical protein
MASGDGKKDIIVEAVEAAKKELKTYKDMPEHYSVMMKYPNIDAKGYYSEIDMDIAARFRRCDTYAKSKSIYEQAMYNHLRQEIVMKGADLKEKVEAVSQQHRVLTRAARLCKDEDAKKIIEHYLRNKKCDESVDAVEISRFSRGHTCAELETVINEAGLYAAYDGRELLNQEDLKNACIRRFYGISNDDYEASEEVIRKRVVHEAGHVVIAELREPGMVDFASVSTMQTRGVGGYISKK